ncbi:MAG: DMT family transporter [bacterium]|nr:MAG: DMT family transporter [bacterium]
MNGKDRLTAPAMLTLVALCTIWGVNMVAIKISNRGLAPATAAALRSAVASALLMVWMRRRGIPLFHRGKVALWGGWAGILFGLEFLLLYAGLDRTSASRGVVLLYTSPFFVAAGAHFYLPGDRLTWRKTLGLLLAFAGVSAVMGQHALTFDAETIAGDTLAIGAGAAWGLTTLVIKKHLAGRIEAIQSLHYQLFFSLFLLVPAAIILEPRPILDFTAGTALALGYQCIVVALFSYLTWFVLIHRYPASRVASFSFFAPVMGVLAGGLLLNESWPPALLFGLAGVAAGIFFVNR